MAEEKIENKHRYIISGGGTAGHVYPGLALAECIRHQEPLAEILYVGAKNGAEERLVPAKGLRLLTLPVKGLPGKKNVFRFVKALMLLLLALTKALWIILKFRPQAILGTGGYASSPILLAGLALKTVHLWQGVLALHEQNILPGRFNQWMSSHVDFIGVSFPNTLSRLPKGKAKWTGYTLRKELLRDQLQQGPTTRLEFREQMGIPPDAQTLLIFGGSSGARTINQAVLKALPALLSRRDRRELVIFHATGYRQGTYDPQQEMEACLSNLSNEKEDIANHYRPQAYMDRIEQYFRIADLVITRAGAGSVWEIASMGIPAILIPKSNLPGDHQVKNARFLEQQGSACLLYEKKDPFSANNAQEYVDTREFTELIFSLLDDSDRREQMRQRAQRMTIPDGASVFYEQIQNLISGYPPDDEKASPLAEESCPMEWSGLAKVLQILEKKWDQGQELASDDKKYVAYKIDQLLCSPQWQARNMGIKFIGLIRSHQKLPVLIHAITDRTKAPWTQRLLGGDFEQVGFIRRNAVQAIRRIGVWNPDIRKGLITALSDPYFEVRSWAALTVNRLSDQIGQDREIETLLRKNLTDRWFEVIVASLDALGKIAYDAEVFSNLVSLFEHKNWKVQEAAVRCLMTLLERDIVQLPPKTIKWMRNIPMKGLDFSPQFPLKKTWESFQDFLTQRSPNNHHTSLH